MSHLCPPIAHVVAASTCTNAVRAPCEKEGEQCLSEKNLSLHCCEPAELNTVTFSSTIYSSFLTLRKILKYFNIPEVVSDLDLELIRSRVEGFFPHPKKGSIFLIFLSLLEVYDHYILIVSGL